MANVIDSISYVNQTSDVSFGRYPDGSQNWHSMTITTPGASNQLLILPDLDDLYINEFLANNNGLYLDEFGDDDDYIEIYNNGPVSIDIGGLYMTDNLAEPLLWQIPDTDPSATTINPGEFLLLWADNEPLQGAIHLGFKLGTSGEQIGLTNLVDTIPEILDSLSFGPQAGNISYGRYPDGATTFFSFETTTPGAPNDLGMQPFVDFSALVINEFMADNDSAFTDNFAEYQDWIEIYNPTSQAIDIGGLYLTDDTNDPAQYEIPKNYPDSTTIPANGFMLFWADSDSEKGVQHTNFKLGQAGEEVGLYYVTQTDTLPIDTLSFGTQMADTSYGRYADGANDWYYMDLFTPGSTNILATTSDNHTLSMIQGWNIISSYVEPDTLVLPTVFQPILSSVNIVKNGDGQVYWPQFNVNMIGLWAFKQGYLIKVDSPQSLTITGTSVTPETNPLTLSAGWSMIAYLRNSPLSIDTIFNPIMGNVGIMKNGDGQVYWPQFNINLIGDMEPGQGYLLKMTIGDTLTYPPN